MEDVGPLGHIGRVAMGLLIYAFFGVTILTNATIRPLFWDVAPFLIPLHLVGVGFGAYLGNRRAFNRVDPARTSAWLPIAGAFFLVILMRDSPAQELFVIFSFLPLSYMVGLNLGLAYLKWRRPDAL